MEQQFENLINEIKGINLAQLTDNQLRKFAGVLNLKSAYCEIELYGRMDDRD